MLWIPGAKGLVGQALSHLRPDALQTGREVDIGKKEVVESFVKANRVTQIINCAAFSLVDAAEDHRNLAYSVNVLGPENLGRLGIPLIHISTDYVFPGDGKTPLKETDPTGPINYYGETKLLGEQRALTHGACVVRTSWVFGKGGKNYLSKLLQLKESEIRLTNDQWSRFTYAPDLAAALLKLLGQKGLYHFANQGVATKYEFGLAIDKTKVVPVPGAYFSSKAKRPIYTAFDTSKIEQLMPIRSWREALQEYLCTS